MINQTLRDEKIDRLSSELYGLYSDPESGALMSEVYSKYSSVPDAYIQYAQSIGDTILGFHKTSDLPQLLQTEVGVSADDAMRIIADLQEFLAPVIAREKGGVNPNREELKELQDTFTPSPTVAAATPPTDAEIQETASAPGVETSTQVQAMRTMEGDMSRIHGYGAYRAKFPEEDKGAEHTEEIIRTASQEDLLKEKPKLAAMPTYEDSGEKG